MPSPLPPLEGAATRPLSGERTPHIAIWGFGREGRASLTVLQDRYPQARFTLLADAPIPEPPAGTATCIGSAAEEALRQGRFDLVVKSPGISLYRPEIPAARAAGTRFTSGTNLWFESLPPGIRTLVVTGTKGKSTTASLAHHMLNRLGKQEGAGSVPASVLGGNVGRPLLDIALPSNGPGPIVVAELSSYQIADLNTAPTVAVITNLSPEHIPWHGDVETYYRDKLRVLDLEPSPSAVINAADPGLRRHCGERPDVLWFGGPEGFQAEADGVYQGLQRVAPATALPLRGHHNLENLAAAMAALAAMGVDPVPAIPGLADFPPLPHRLQVIGERAGVHYVNDSISTTPISTLAALEAFAGRPLLLLLGGTDRGQDFGPLATALADSDVTHVFTLPDTGARAAAAIRAAAPAVTVTDCHDLDTAVTAAGAAARPGSVVLLSPAAPSFGAFRDFEARGQAFIRAAGFEKNV